MSMNIIDKTISYFSPKLGLERAKMRNAISFLGGSDYDSITKNAHYNVYSIESSDIEDIRYLKDMRATARSYFENNGFYGGIIECSIDHVIGSGLRAKSTIKQSQVPNISKIRIKEIETIFDNYFNSWAESTICDVTGKDDFYAIQRLAYSNYKVDGDSFALTPLRKLSKSSVLQIDMVDAQYIVGQSNDKTFIEGIKISDDGMPMQYSIKMKDGTYKIISAFKNSKKNVLHTFKRRRSKQVRGLPFLNRVSTDIVYIDDYMKTELNASKLAAIFFGSITTKAEESMFGESDLLTNGNQKQTARNTIKENTITQLSPGEELKIHSQARDNGNFDRFIMACLQKVSSSTRIPLEIILAQFVSSYSASRAALLQMQKFTKPERQLFITSFCKPIREQVLTWGILNGDLNIPEFIEYKNTLLKCIWIGEAMGSVDPTKDVKANILAVEGKFKTYEQATMELGNGDFETNVQIMTTELEEIKKINKIGEVDGTSKTK